MRAAMLTFLLLTGCALIPVNPDGWLANRAKDRKYCETARANGWVGPMSERLRCGVDPLPVPPPVKETDNPCAVVRSFWSPAYSERPLIRRLQVLKLWPMSRALVFAPGPGMVRPAVNDPSACPK